MEYLIIILLLVVAIVLLAYIFGFSIKKIKEIANNEKLNEITNKFPNNIEICKYMLKNLDNKNVKIKENKESSNSLYIAITNKILIGNTKENYTRIQTIAHECLHSIQNKKVLLFNFFYSNIYLLYFILIVIFTILKIIINPLLHICILTILGFIYYAVRAFLETDAMTKAKYLAKEYMTDVNICSKEEIDKVIKEYDKLNNIGILAVNYTLFFNVLIRVIIYAVIAVISVITTLL